MMVVRLVEFFLIFFNFFLEVSVLILFRFRKYLKISLSNGFRFDGVIVYYIYIIYIFNLMDFDRKNIKIVEMESSKALEYLKNLNEERDNVFRTQ